MVFLFIQKTQKMQGRTDVPKEILDILSDAHLLDLVSAKPQEIPDELKAAYTRIQQIVKSKGLNINAVLIEAANDPKGQPATAGFFFGLGVDYAGYVFQSTEGSHRAGELDIESLNTFLSGFFQGNSVATDYASYSVEISFKQEMQEFARQQFGKNADKDLKKIGKPRDVGFTKVQAPSTFSRVQIPKFVLAQLEVPSLFLISVQVPNASKLDAAIIKSLAVIGGSKNQDTGQINIPAFVSGGAIALFKQTVRTEFGNWLDSDLGGQTVIEYVRNDLKDPSKAAEFREALLSGRFREAKDMLKADSVLYGAINGEHQEFKNLSTAFSSSDIKGLLNHSLSGIGSATYQISDVTAVQIYIMQDSTVLVTNDVLNTTTTGARLLASIKGLKLSVGTSAVFSKDQSPQLMVDVGAEQDIPLNNVLSAVLSGSFASLYGKGHEPFYGMEIQTGVKIKPTSKLTVDLSAVFNPPTTQTSEGFIATTLENAGMKLRANYNISTNFNLGLDLGVMSFKKNQGALPWTAQLNLGITLP